MIPIVHQKPDKDLFFYRGLMMAPCSWNMLPWLCVCILAIKWCVRLNDSRIYKVDLHKSCQHSEKKFNSKLKDSNCSDTSLHIMISVWPNLQQCIWVSNDTFVPAVSGHCPKSSAIRTKSSRRMSELQSVLSLQKELWYPWLMFCILCMHLGV